MAIKVNTTVDGKSYPEAYVRVARITRVEKDVACEGVVWVYANEADRLVNRPPVQQYRFQSPYSDQPYGALYAELKKGYPGHTNL